MKKMTKKDLVDFIIITLALLFGAIGWVVFLLPNHIASGGLAGIASILYWGFSIPVGATYLLINLILLALAYRILGLKFIVRTIYCVAMFTVFISVIEKMTGGVSFLSDEPFMATILGAGMLGASGGVILVKGGSTGGSDVVASMINKYHDISLGHAIMALDLVIVTSSWLVLRDWETVFYGYVELFVCAMCIDWMVNSLRRSVQFFIISDKYEEIGHAINLDLRRGCTVVDAQGLYTKKEMKMLFVLAKRNQSSKIFRIIETIDPTAFVSQSAVIGVYGLGFDPFKHKAKKTQELEIKSV